MAFDGNGNFTNPYNWTNDAAAGVKIRADRMDGQDSGIATGLSTCVTKDGQTNPTANLKMANFRHTGVGNAQARTDYAAAGQVADGALMWGGTAGGTATALTISLTPAITAYAAGQRFAFIAASNATTAATTLNVNGVGAKTIKKNYNDDLNSKDFIASQVVQVFYDGTNFQLIQMPNVTGYYLKQAVYNSQYFS